MISRSTKETDRRRALVRAIEIEAEVTGSPLLGRVPTLADFSPSYIEFSRLHKRSWARDALSLRNLCEGLGTLALDRIDRNQVDRYIARRLTGSLMFGRKKPGVSTVNREIACLRHLLNLAVGWSKIRVTPLKIKLPKEPEGRVRYLEPEEARRLLECCAPHLRPIVVFALHTGMRRGEVLGLMWSEVDLGRAVITLPGSRTKNKRERTVPLDEVVLKVLQDAERHRAPNQPRVFHKQDGSPLGEIQTAFRNAVRRAALKDFHFHDLRHTFASGLAMQGVSQKFIGELLGHRTMAMTDRYTHLSPGALKEASGKATAYFAKGEVEGAPLPENITTLTTPLDVIDSHETRANPEVIDGGGDIIPLFPKQVGR